MILIALAALVGCTLQDPTVPVPFQATSAVTVFRSGTEGYATFRIPSIVALPAGELLAFAEGRKNGSSDTGDIDLVLKRSGDGGASWSALEVLWDDGNNVCGNPCVVHDQVTGVLHLLATRNLGSDHESEIIRGSSEGSRTVWTLTSKDNGATWTKPKEITETTKLATWTWYATGPGIGIQLEQGPKKGRLVIPCDHIELDTKRYFSHLLVSDDHGATWRIGGVSTRDQLNECQVAELGPGRLVMNMRNYDRAQKTRAVTESTDSGETFGPVRWEAALPDPICQAGLLAVDGTGGKRVLYFSNCASATRRERMTLKRSLDAGATWEEVGVLHAGPSAYSCLVEMPAPNAGASAIGCLFECGEKGAYERIDFQIR